jgi:hypothetical protein
VNYDKARERITENGRPSGLWEWSSLQNGHVGPTVPCSGLCRHISREEAEKHFYDHSLERVRVHEDRAVHECQACGDRTHSWLGNKQFWLIPFGAWLCEEHCNRVELVKLFPFRAGTEMLHS